MPCFWRGTYCLDSSRIDMNSINFSFFLSSSPYKNTILLRPVSKHCWMFILDLGHKS